MRIQGREEALPGLAGPGPAPGPESGLRPGPGAAGRTAPCEPTQAELVPGQPRLDPPVPARRLQL